jgi:hypothetical protein
MANSELERIQNDVNMTYFTVLTWHLPEGSAKKLKKINFIHSSWSPGRHSNLQPYKYKAGMLTTTLKFSNNGENRHK